MIYMLQICSMSIYTAWFVVTFKSTEVASILYEKCGGITGNAFVGFLPGQYTPTGVYK